MNCADTGGKHRFFPLGWKRQGDSVSLWEKIMRRKNAQQSKVN